MKNILVDIIGITMSLLQEIYNGWKNYIFPNKDIEEIAKKRIAICVKNKCGKFTPKKTCKVCGCYMPAKVRSKNSNCPLKKWDVIDNENKK